MNIDALPSPNAYITFSFRSIPRQMRISEKRLLDMALGALEEVAATCHHQPVPRSKALALVLAYLASRGRGVRSPYDSFWRSVDHPRPKDRWSGVNASLNGIYLAVGVKRDLAVVSLYEERARAAHSATTGEQF